MKKSENVKVTMRMANRKVGVIVMMMEMAKLMDWNQNSYDMLPKKKFGGLPTKTLIHDNDAEPSN
jgi:hypothetical protein